MQLKLTNCMCRCRKSYITSKRWISVYCEHRKSNLCVGWTSFRGRHAMESQILMKTCLNNCRCWITSYSKLKSRMMVAYVMYHVKQRNVLNFFSSLLFHYTETFIWYFQYMVLSFPYTVVNERLYECSVYLSDF